MSEDPDTWTPTPKKAKTDVSGSAWDTLRQSLAVPSAPPSEVRGLESGSAAATSTEADAQMFFGESICVLVTEEARNLVCGAPVGDDMVCFNPKCGVEAHKTGNRAFPDFDTGIFIRAGDAPTKRFRFRRQPIGGMDLFNRHSSVLRRIKEYDPLVWESLEETLNQQPVVDP